jgi:hypothetical protein
LTGGAQDPEVRAVSLAAKVGEGSVRAVDSAKAEVNQEAQTAIVISERSLRESSGNKNSNFQLRIKNYSRKGTNC